MPGSAVSPNSVSIEHERKWIITIERLDEIWPRLDRPKFILDVRDEHMLPDIIKITLTAGKVECIVSVTGLRELKAGGLGKMTTYTFYSGSDQIPLWLQDKVQIARNRYDLPVIKVVQAKRKITI
jgi:hypothetical protein